jgi:hypothetical protein
MLQAWKHLYVDTMPGQLRAGGLFADGPASPYKLKLGKASPFTLGHGQQPKLQEPLQGNVKEVEALALQRHPPERDIPPPLLPTSTSATVASRASRASVSAPNTLSPLNTLSPPNALSPPTYTPQEKKKDDATKRNSLDISGGGSRSGEGGVSRSGVLIIRGLDPFDPLVVRSRLSRIIRPRILPDQILLYPSLLEGGTQFTRFTGTYVQILTQTALQTTTSWPTCASSRMAVLLVRSSAAATSD